MAKDLVLNELSVREAQSLYMAREQMRHLIATLIAAVQAGSSRSLRTHTPIDSMLLASGYSISRWRNDPAVEREQRSYLRSLLSKSPFLTTEDNPDIMNRSLQCDVLFDGQSSAGLRAAFVLGGLAVSMASDPCWDHSRLSITCLSLEESGELSEDLTELPHASRAEHIAEHTDWFAGRDLPIGGGRDLWERRHEFFPALVFCDSVGGQLEDIHSGDPLLRQIYKRLLELDRYAQGWTGSFDPSTMAMKITPESDSTLQSYNDEHSFVCPDGVRRLFSWHCRLTPGAWRLYFFPHPESVSLIVGYIGKKLPGVLYRT